MRFFKTQNRTKTLRICEPAYDSASSVNPCWPLGLDLPYEPTNFSIASTYQTYLMFIIWKKIFISQSSKLTLNEARKHRDENENPRDLLLHVL
jgi:hypothetical protein